jgi:hypothetical protein
MQNQKNNKQQVFTITSTMESTITLNSIPGIIALKAKELLLVSAPATAEGFVFTVTVRAPSFTVATTHSTGWPIVSDPRLGDTNFEGKKTVTSLIPELTTYLSKKKKSHKT